MKTRHKEEGLNVQKCIPCSMRDKPVVSWIATVVARYAVGLPSPGWETVSGTFVLKGYTCDTVYIKYSLTILAPL